MNQVEEYRTRILQALAAATKADGTPRLSELQVKKLGNEFSDEELIDGMDFNTPEEVAQMLLDAGLA